MDTATHLGQFGQYFVLGYRPRLSRREVRSVGVALVADSGDYAMVKHLPPSQLAANVRDQGILDAALVGIARSIQANAAAAIDRLATMRGLDAGALVVGPPMPADLGVAPTVTLDALFKALVAQRTSRRPGLRKSQLLDSVVDRLRQSGATVRRGEYLDDFLMDAVLASEDKGSTAVHVESFATSGRDWSRAEQEAGYFLYALDQLGLDGLLVTQEPNEASDEAALKSFERVQRWSSRSGLVRATPADLPRIAAAFSPTEQLPLVMA
jgi:hypothetical protein